MVEYEPWNFTSENERWNDGVDGEISCPRVHLHTKRHLMKLMLLGEHIIITVMCVFLSDTPLYRCGVVKKSSPKFTTRKVLLLLLNLGFNPSGRLKLSWRTPNFAWSSCTLPPVSVLNLWMGNRVTTTTPPSSQPSPRRMGKFCSMGIFPVAKAGFICMFKKNFSLSVKTGWEVLLIFLPQKYIICTSTKLETFAHFPNW